MKKLILSIVSSALFAVSSYAASGVWTISNGNCSNLISAPIKVTALTYISSTTNTTQFNLVDSPTTSLTNIIGAYSTVTEYATNYIATWVNFYGVTNSYTNVALVSLTNSVTAQTNLYPVRATLQTGTNQQVSLTGLSYFFGQGLTVTNTGAGPVTINVTWTGN